MNILPLQKEVLDSDKRITIIATGGGSGKTTALEYVALTSRESVGGFTFVYPTYNEAHDAFRSFRRKYQYLLNAECISVRNLQMKRSDGEVIRFISTRDYRCRPRGVLLCEDPTRMSSEWLCRELNTKSKMYFTTSPYECGYRNPLYENGLLVRDDKGKVCYSNKSWDSALIDWCKSTTKAQISDYKPFVKVITGFDAMSNPFMEDSFHEAVNRLPEQRKKEFFYGEWLCSTD